MNKNTKQDRIRTILRDSGGLTADVIAERMNSDANMIRVVLNQMPDSYIGRWERTKAGAGYKAVWNVAHVPADAPRPQSVPTERKVYDKQYRERRKAKAKAAPAPEPATATPKTRWVTPPHGPTDMTKLDSTGTAAVDHNYFWQPIATCPRGVKVQLLGKGGVALYGQYHGKDTFYTHWAPLPKLRKTVE